MGRVVGVHGIAGLVKIESYASPREAIFRYRPWIMRLGGVERVVEEPRGRVQGKGLVAELPGCADPAAARAQYGAEIEVPRSALPPLAKGEYYWIDLVGLRVINLEGIELGAVARLFATGANDVMVVRGERERLLPFVQGPYVKKVDLAAGEILVDWDPEF
ncbi:MAG TPA: ribosome maturation factor RimM [Xanthomonadaceae bacterium]|nr:ribosome maturation factor RimM [Xanthomonadaceae bacterium]